MRRVSHTLLTRAPTPRLRATVWIGGLVVIVALGLLRTSTDAEYAFASAAIIPVVAIAWIGGRREGLIISVLVAIMWGTADWLGERQFTADWIPIVNALVRLATYAFISMLAADVKTLLTRERDMATRDPLTGLLNRRAFFEAGDEDAERAERYGHRLAVAFLDLDNFKRLNDEQGHDTGDRALKAVAAALRASLRHTDRIARLGGDEFAVLLPEIDYAAATDAGNKIAAAIGAAMTHFPPVSASVGVVWFESAAAGFAAMVRAADALMYEIKRAGKCGVRTRRFATFEAGQANTSGQE